MIQQEWFCRSLFGMICDEDENDGRDHDQCGWVAIRDREPTPNTPRDVLMADSYPGDNDPFVPVKETP